MTEKEALFVYSLRCADDALMQSYRLSEWCSKAPLLEEDLALTNMALDMTGRAQLLLSYAALVDGSGKRDDDLAYRREEHEYLNHLIAELPNTDFAYTMARQFFLSAFEYIYYTMLSQSNDSTLASIAAKTVKETKYHLSHCTDWIIRLGDGTDESHARMQAAINDLWPYTGELFEKDEVEALLIGKAIAVDSSLLRADWELRIATTLEQATLSMPQGQYFHTGGRKGVHSEYLGHILSEMQYLQRAYPDASW